jgi:hypothetical protein
MVIAFKALVDLPEAWPKSNDFGHSYYRKKIVDNAWRPKEALSDSPNEAGSCTISPFF